MVHDSLQRCTISCNPAEVVTYMNQPFGVVDQIAAAHTMKIPTGAVVSNGQSEPPGQPHLDNASMTSRRSADN